MTPRASLHTFPFPISPPWASLLHSPTLKKKLLAPGLALLWREQRTQPRLCGRRNLPFRSRSFQLRNFRCLGIQGRLLATFVLHHFQTRLLHLWPYRPLCVGTAVIWCQRSGTGHSRGVLFWTSGQSRGSTWLSCPWVQSSFCGALSFPLIFPDQVSGSSVLDRASRTPPGIFVCLHGHRSLSTLTTIKVQIRFGLNSTSWPTSFSSLPSELWVYCGTSVSHKCEVMRRKCLRSVVLAFTEELVRPPSVLGKPTIVNYISELQKGRALVCTVQRRLRGNSWR